MVKSIQQSRFHYEVSADAGTLSRILEKIRYRSVKMPFTEAMESPWKACGAYQADKFAINRIYICLQRLI